MEAGEALRTGVGAEVAAILDGLVGLKAAVGVGLFGGPSGGNVVGDSQEAFSGLARNFDEARCRPREGAYLASTMRSVRF